MRAGPDYCEDVIETEDLRFRNETENSRIEIEQLLHVQAIVLRANARVMPAERARLRLFVKDFSAATITKAIVAKKLVAADLCPARPI